MDILITYPQPAVSEIEPADVVVVIFHLTGNQKTKRATSSSKVHFSTDHVTDELFDFNTISLESERDICAVIPLEGELLSYVNILFDNKVRQKALIDTGSCANAIPENLLEQLKIERKRASRFATNFLHRMFLYFAKLAEPHFVKSKIQRMSPNFVHCM